MTRGVLPPHLKGVLIFFCIFLNTAICVIPLYFFAILKLLIPYKPVRNKFSLILVKIAEFWISVNNFLLFVTQEMEWEVSGLEDVEYAGWYLVICNHQSWADILVLQRILNRKIPFLKFFLKQELIWVPLIGPAWWALDFPFMKRYSQAHLAKRPQDLGKDLAITRQACEKFRETPVSIMNFVEGTRYTEERRQAQRSPFDHLLKPKVGGVSFVIESMGDIVKEVVNVTIIYPQSPAPTFLEFLGMKKTTIKVIIEKQTIPENVLYQNDQTPREFKVSCRKWVNALWSEKDSVITEQKAV